MTLKKDAKKLFLDLFGPQIAKQLNTFDDPGRYPNDFLNECKHFMSQLIGVDAAERKLGPLFKKYSRSSK